MKKTVFLMVIGLISLMAGVSAQNIPTSPSDVYVDQSSNSLMLKKPTDNNYQQFTIKGINWSAATGAPKEELIKYNNGFSRVVDFGFFFDWYGRNPQGHKLLEYWLRKELINRYSTDIPLIKNVNANTIRLYNCNLGYGEDSGSPTFEIQAILDECYKNNIMVIMTTAISKEDLDSQKYLTRVDCWKNHPAVLMWVIGNEWNFNKFYATGSLYDVAGAVNQVAKNIKAIDPHHPVCSVLGDRVSDFPVILANCPDVDVWGVNIYRGNSFGNFFDQWKKQWQNLGKPIKPVFISEFGIDSFYTENCTIDVSSGLIRADNVTGRDAQQKQADVDSALWQEINTHLSVKSSDGFCLGGLIFEFNDELWKVGSYHVGLGGLVDYSAEPDSHSYDDYNDEGIILSDSIDNTKPISENIYFILNEEHCGLVTAGRIPKQAYTKIKEAWKNFVPEAPKVTDEGAFTARNNQLSVSWGIDKEEKSIKAYEYKITLDNSQNSETIPNGSGVIDDGAIRKITVNTLDLKDGEKYYFGLRVTSNGIDWSDYSYSDGIVIDTTKPTTPKVTAKYDSYNGYITASYSSFDDISGIAGYKYAVGTAEGKADVSGRWIDWRYKSLDYNCRNLTEGKTYYISAQAKNGAGLWSDIGTAKIEIPISSIELNHTPVKEIVREKDLDIIVNVNNAQNLRELRLVYQYCQKQTTRWNSIRWDWRTNGMFLQQDSQGVFKAIIPSSRIGEKGIKYYIYGYDKKGRRYDAVLPYQVVEVKEPLPAIKILHTPATIVNRSSPLTITVQIENPQNLASLVLEYKYYYRNWWYLNQKTAQISFQKDRQNAAGIYKAVIPADHVVCGSNIEYRMIGEDKAGVREEVGWIKNYIR